MFVRRQEELEQIKNLLNNNNKKAIMLYGKRRVGKSTLILEAIKGCSYKIIYYECLLTTVQENIKNLESKIQETFNNKFLHFETLADIFDFLGKCNEKIVVILDEYSYLKSLAPKYYVDSLFQSIIDQMNNNLSLILLGSYVGMMKELLEKENPLFGRFSLILNIKPFDYLDSSLFYKSCSVQQKIEFYSVFGGRNYSIQKALCLITEINEHPLDFNRIDYDKKIIDYLEALDIGVLFTNCIYFLCGEE